MSIYLSASVSILFNELFLLKNLFLSLYESGALHYCINLTHNARYTIQFYIITFNRNNTY